MRRALDRLYDAAFALAAACFAAIAVLVMLQILGRLADRGISALGGTAPGLAIPSLAEIGAFLFVSAVFLGLAGTLRRGAHVRVTLATQRLAAGPARILSALVIAAALALGLWASWNALGMVRDSLKFGDVSYGMIPIPLALPQGMMTLGLAVFCIALADEGWSVLRGRPPAFRRAEAETERAGAAGAAGEDADGGEGAGRHESGPDREGR